MQPAHDKRFTLLHATIFQHPGMSRSLAFSAYNIIHSICRRDAQLASRLLTDCRLYFSKETKHSLNGVSILLLRLQKKSIFAGCLKFVHEILTYLLSDDTYLAEQMEHAIRNSFRYKADPTFNKSRDKKTKKSEYEVSLTIEELYKEHVDLATRSPDLFESTLKKVCKAKKPRDQNTKLDKPGRYELVLINHELVKKQERGGGTPKKRGDCVATAEKPPLPPSTGPGLQQPVAVPVPWREEEEDLGGAAPMQVDRCGKGGEAAAASSSKVTKVKSGAERVWDGSCGKGQMGETTREMPTHPNVMGVWARAIISTRPAPHILFV